MYKTAFSRPSVPRNNKGVDGQQVQRVVATTKQEAEHKFEAEKRQLQLKLETEITELQTHLRLFQKLENWLSKEQQAGGDQETWLQLDQVSAENRQLKLSLADTQTKMALLQTELSQIKSHYEKKYRLLLKYSMLT